MDDKIIRLTTREELNIYMSPVRQELLRLLRLADGPMTPKALADKLGISPSSVQHHLKRLLSLGVVEVERQEKINGITATYYREVLATVRVGLERGDDLREEREAMMTAVVNRTLRGFLELIRSAPKNLPPDELMKHATLMNGVMRLGPHEREKLMALVNQFLLEHDAPAPERTERWEYVVLAYQAEEEL